MFRFAATSLVLPSSTSQLMPPPGKRLLEKDPVIMVPVHVDDFKKLNEFAESAWVQREVTKSPGQAEKLMNNIKDTRRRLLNQVRREKSIKRNVEWFLEREQIDVIVVFSAQPRSTQED